jgi:DNA-binding XRE family transcriptional regulator
MTLIIEPFPLYLTNYIGISFSEKALSGRFWCSSQMKTSRNPVKDQLAAFGPNLKQCRLRHEWTMVELAQRSGLSKPFLSRLESGDRQPSIAAVLTLSQVLGVSPATMFEIQSPPKKVSYRPATGLRLSATQAC